MHYIYLTHWKRLTFPQSNSQQGASRHHMIFRRIFLKIFQAMQSPFHLLQLCLLYTSFRRFPERNQGEQATGGFLPVRKTGESAQTDVGKTVLQFSGRGCTELPDKKGEGAKTVGPDKGGHGTDHPGKPEPHRLPVRLGV